MILYRAGHVAAAPDTSPAAATKAAAPTTALEAGPFARADVIVAARVTEVTDVRAPGGGLGRQVVQARVSRAMKGTLTKDVRITVLVAGQRPTLDPSRPSVPYFRKHAHQRYVLFLRRAPGEHVYRLQTLYDAEDRTGPEKVSAVTAVASWAGEVDADRKARKTLAGLMKMIKSRGRWAPGFAARELAFLAGRHPEVFDRRTLAQLTRLAAVGGDADLRFWVRRLEPLVREGRRAKGAVAAAAGDPWRQAFLAAPRLEDREQLLGRLLRTGGPAFERQAWWAWHRLEPSGRAWFVGAFGGRDALASTARLRLLYGAEDDLVVRTTLVRALGLRGGDADVGWLIARLGNPDVRPAALIALARVRTRAALAGLRAARRGRSADEVRWIDYLLGSAFVESERRAGR